MKFKGVYINGIDELIGEHRCTISDLNNELNINIDKSKTIIHLSYDKIIAVGGEKEVNTQTVETNKSPIARGIVGGALFGGAGLVLGGLSGLNKKTTTVKNTNNYVYIKYKNSDNQENILTFKILSSYKQFVRIVNLRARKNQPKDIIL